MRLSQFPLWSARAKYRDYRELFGSAAGKRVLADLIRRGHVLGPTTAHAGDGILTALETARREGERGVALYILGILSWTPEDIRCFSETKEISE